MDNERIRAICMALPHVAETVSWGHHLVYAYTLVFERLPKKVKTALAGAEGEREKPVVGRRNATTARAKSATRKARRA